MAASKRCAECGHAVSPQARFCELCGSALGAAEPVGGRRGDALESVAGERSLTEGERKQVTVMFVDIARSMELTRSLDTERWGVVLDRFLAIAYEVVDDFDGTINQFTGDGLMAVFGAPVAREDHAQRACLASLELHTRVVSFAEELARVDAIEFAIRCGLSSGEVVVGSIGSALRLDFAPIGNISGLGQRMESLAPVGSTALSAPTAALVEGEFELRVLGEFEVKGLGESQRVYELLGAAGAGAGFEVDEEAALLRFVGRKEERALLDAALERARGGDGGTIGIRGEAGVGKSRLLREFTRACRERGRQVHAARAAAHGRAPPLSPVLALLRGLLGVEEQGEPEATRAQIESVLGDLDPALEPDLPLLLEFLGVADPERRAERIDPEARRRRLLATVRGLVTALSEREPLIVAIEDLHWLDAASADFVEELARAATGAGALLLATFRPEYEAVWTESPAYEELLLAPLDTASSIELLAELLGGDPSLEGLSEAVEARTRGNPFFIEEVVRALEENGRLVGERGSYRFEGSVDELTLPPTVQAVLGARIDRLGGREKSLLETMAVIGREVDRAVLREVAGLERAELGGGIAVLIAAEFVVEGGDSGQRELSFTHPLTQEVAYASQLSEPRSRAHAAVAAAIERVHPDGLEERAVLLARHWEAAGDLFKAAKWHARAAVWLTSASPAEGRRHWRRVSELADLVEPSPGAARLASAARAGILTASWRIGITQEEAAAIYAEAGGRLEASGEVTDEGAMGKSGEDVLLDTAYASNVFTGGREREGLELLRQASSDAEEIGDPLSLFVADTARACMASAVGLYGECVEAADRSLRQIGNDRAAGASLGSGTYYANCLTARASGLGAFGRYERALRDIARALEVASEFGDVEAETFALVTRGSLHGDMLESRRGLPDAERAAEIAERTGGNLFLVAAYLILARLRADCEEFEAARATAERAVALTREHGAGRNVEPDIHCHLAIAQLGLGEGGPARESAERAVTIAESRSLTRSLAVSRLGLGRVLTGLGEADAAEEALREALAAAAELGYRALEPRIHRELAAVARLRDESAAAGRAEAEAARLLAEFRAPEASVA
jgi:class 3 adenylate cyclase/tetratricopeptide (TPR) repeat protein